MVILDKNDKDEGEKNNGDEGEQRQRWRRRTTAMKEKNDSDERGEWQQ